MRIFGDIVRKKFQCHEAAQLGVLGFVHYAHAAAAEFFKDPILAESFADHGWILRWNLICAAIAESKPMLGVSLQNENVRFVQSRNVRFHRWPRAPWRRSESL